MITQKRRHNCRQAPNGTIRVVDARERGVMESFYLRVLQKLYKELDKFRITNDLEDGNLTLGFLWEHIEVSGKVFSFGRWHHYAWKGRIGAMTIEFSSLSVAVFVNDERYSPVGRYELPGPYNEDQTEKLHVVPGIWWDDIEAFAESLPHRLAQAEIAQAEMQEIERSKEEAAKAARLEKLTTEYKRRTGRTEP